MTNMMPVRHAAIPSHSRDYSQPSSSQIQSTVILAQARIHASSVVPAQARIYPQLFPPRAKARRFHQPFLCPPCLQPLPVGLICVCVWAALAFYYFGDGVIGFLQAS
jgi:hypothetical protein